MGAVAPFSRVIPVRARWLARRAELALEPALPIVDPHHHLWDRPGSRYLAEDFEHDLAQGHDVRATIHVQARSAYRATGPEALRPVGETEFVLAEAARRAGRAAIGASIVGYADLMLGDAVDEVLEAHLATGRGRFRGIRHIVAHDADPVMVASGNPAPAGLLGNTRFRAGFARLEHHGLSFDAWLYHTQLDELAALAAAFPGTSIVVDHYGGPLGVGGHIENRSETFARWRAGMRRLATHPNVSVKLGGLGMAVNGFGFERLPEPPSSDLLAKSWRPYFETCIEAFGAGRCMFESNFPVDKGSYGYGVFWNACKKLAAGLSADEKRAVFHDTAARVYRLPPVGQA